MDTKPNIKPMFRLRASRSWYPIKCDEPHPMSQMDALEIRDPNAALAPLRLCFDLGSFDARRIVQAMCALEQLYGSRFAVARTTTILRTRFAAPPQAAETGSTADQHEHHNAPCHFLVDLVPCQAEDTKCWNRFKLRVLAMFRSSFGQRSTADVIGSTAALSRNSQGARSTIEAEFAFEMSRRRRTWTKALGPDATLDPLITHHATAEYATWIVLLRQVGFSSAPIQHRVRRNGRRVLVEVSST